MRIFEDQRGPQLYEESRKPYGNLEQMFERILSEDLGHVERSARAPMHQPEPKRFLSLDNRNDSDYQGGMSMSPSQQAFKSIQGIAPNLREQVYNCIAGSLYGMTDDEVEVALDMRHQTASARRRELVKSNRIKDSGRRRATRSGRSATVWITV